MLTVRYQRLGLAPGDLLLDLGCGFGRHALRPPAAEPGWWPSTTRRPS